MRMLLVLQIIMATDYKKLICINCLDYIDKKLYEEKGQVDTGNVKNVFSDSFMEYLKNKTLKFSKTGVEKQKLFKRMYHKLEKAEQLSQELKRFTIPGKLHMSLKSTIKTTPKVTPCILDQLINFWVPGNPDYSECTDFFNFGIPKNLTVVHRYLLPVTQKGMYNLKPVLHDIVNSFTHIYMPTSHRPRPFVPLVTTTTERLTLSEEIHARYNTKEVMKRYGVHMSEFTSSDSSSEKKTFIKENNTLILHDLDCSDFFDPRSGVMRRKKFTRPLDPSNKTTLRPPSKGRRKKYWGPRIYEKLRLLNDSKRVKKILSEYDHFMLNRGSSFNFGHDTSKYKSEAISDFLINLKSLPVNSSDVEMLLAMREHILHPKLFDGVYLL